MKRTTPVRVSAAMLGTALAGLLAVPGVAFAVASGPAVPGGAPAGPAQSSGPTCTPTTFAQAQQQVASELSGRVTQLDTLMSAAGDAANHLTTSDRQTLQNDIGAVELPGIQGLQPQVQQATTCGQLRLDAHTMVVAYRVYLVMTPQTHLTISVDSESSIEALLAGLEPSIASAIQSAQAAGKNVTAAQAADSDLQSQVTAAQAATNGLSAQILAQTPQGSPGNWQVFEAARTSAANARTDLNAAYADARRITADIA